MRASREIAFWLHAELERRRESIGLETRVEGRPRGPEPSARRAGAEVVEVVDRVDVVEGPVRVRRDAALRRQAPPVESVALPGAQAILELLAARPALLASPELPLLLTTAGEIAPGETCLDCGCDFTVDWLACPACGALARDARLPPARLAAPRPEPQPIPQSIPQATPKATPPSIPKPTLKATPKPMAAKRRPSTICPQCGISFPRGKLACPECGSDALTGWKSQSEIDYQAVELPETEPLQAQGGPIPRWLWVGAAIVLVVALLAAVALGF